MRRFGHAILAITFVAICYLLYGEYAHLRVISGGLPSPDMYLTGYSHEQLLDWQTAVGTDGVAEYLKYFGGGFGVILPLLIGASLIILMITALNRFPRFNRRSAFVKILAPVILVLPFVFLDIFENSILFDIVSEPGAWGQGMSQFASILTGLKFAALALALFSLGVFWLAGLKHKNGETQ